MSCPARRALQGVALAPGAPLGWLAFRLLAGSTLSAELVGSWPLYLYMLLGTVLAFGVYGFLLGLQERRLLEGNQRLEKLTVVDALTGLHNARYFQSRLEEEFAESRRSGKPLGLVLLDLDHFKRINDAHGHLTGDSVLKAVGDAIASVTRESETEARIGGEEFAILLPGGDTAAAHEVAERVRRAVGKVAIPLPQRNRTVRVTMSAGVASTAEEEAAAPCQLFEAADDAMYRAKRGGRNRTVAAGGANPASVGRSGGG